MTMRSITGAIVALSIAPVAWGHSINDLETLLGQKEEYFQPIDKQAPQFSLRSADGAAVGLSDLHGKVVVLHFIYAGCPDVCPLHADRIAEVQAMVNRTPMVDQVRFVTVTTDPANDTTQILREYGPAHGFDRANWTFLTTTAEQPEDTTRRLAEAFGHKFKKVEDGYQVHGIVTHVIDKDGRWRANFHGLKFEPVNLVLFINALVNDAQPPHGHRQTKSWWDRMRDRF